MNVLEKCDLCETCLEFEADGKRFRFTAHTEEACRVFTKNRIGMLINMLGVANKDNTILREQLHEAIRGRPSDAEKDATRDRIKLLRELALRGEP